MKRLQDELTQTRSVGNVFFQYRFWANVDAMHTPYVRPSDDCNMLFWCLHLFRNFVYNVSSVSLSVQQRIEWRPSENDTKRCRLYCKQEDECHNYIRIIVRKSDDRLLICGTNAYKPKCREYVIMSKQTLTLSPKAETPLNKRHLFDVEFKVAEEMPGEGLCPYDANHNSTYTFAGTSHRAVARVSLFNQELPF